MLALSRLAIVLDTEEDAGSMKMLQDAVPQMVAVLKEAVDNSDEERTTQSFEVYIKSFEHRASANCANRFFKLYLDATHLC